MLRMLSAAPPSNFLGQPSSVTACGSLVNFGTLYFFCPDFDHLRPSKCHGDYVRISHKTHRTFCTRHSSLDPRLACARMDPILPKSQCAYTSAAGSGTQICTYTLELSNPASPPQVLKHEPQSPSCVVLWCGRVCLNYPRTALCHPLQV